MKIGLVVIGIFIILLFVIFIFRDKRIKNIEKNAIIQENENISTERDIQKKTREHERRGDEEKLHNIDSNVDGVFRDVFGRNK